jgi:acyl-coenzyme A synthetase/AMP-(fatty) acid ligase
MKHAVVPELDDLLAPEPVKSYPFNKTFEEASKYPYIILHTSGSTGLPKPVRYTHGDLAVIDNLGTLTGVDPVSGLVRNSHLTHPPKSRILCPFLHFHGVSSVAMMSAVVFGNATYVSGFRHKILERGDLLKVLEYANIETAFMSPAMIDDLAVNPDAPKYLKRLGMVIYAGGRLSKYSILFEVTNVEY